MKLISHEIAVLNRFSEFRLQIVHHLFIYILMH